MYDKIQRIFVINGECIIKTLSKHLHSPIYRKGYYIAFFLLLYIPYLEIGPKLAQFYLSFFFYSLEYQDTYHHLIAEQVLALKAAIPLLLYMILLYLTFIPHLSRNNFITAKLAIYLIHGLTVLHSAYYLSLSSGFMRQALSYFLPLFICVCLSYCYPAGLLVIYQEKKKVFKGLPYFILFLVLETLGLNLLIFADRSYLYTNDRYSITLGLTQYVTDSPKKLNRLIKAHNLLPEKLRREDLRVVVRAIKDSNRLLGFLGIKDILDDNPHRLGYYSANHRSVFLNRNIDSFDDKELRQLISHELTHVYQDKYSLKGSKWKNEGHAEWIAYGEDGYTGLNFLTMPIKISGTPFENCYGCDPVHQIDTRTYDYSASYLQAWYYFSHLRVSEEEFFSAQIQIAPWDDVLKLYKERMNL